MRYRHWHGYFDGFAIENIGHAGAGPDAVALGVVFAGFLGPAHYLPTLIRIAAACPSAGPEAMRVGGAFTGRPALTSGPRGLPAPLRTCRTLRVRGMKAGRKRLAVCGHGADPLKEHRRG